MERNPATEQWVLTFVRACVRMHRTAARECRMTLTIEVRVETTVPPLRRATVGRTDIVGVGPEDSVVRCKLSLGLSF